MLDYNDRETADRRKNAELLTLEEEKQVIDIINERLRVYSSTREEEELLQTYIRSYQNLSAYLFYTRGMWCTELPEKVIDPQKTLFHLNTKLQTINSEIMHARQEYDVAALLNDMLNEYPYSKGEEDLLQRFLDNYQNMSDYNAYTGGVTGTEGFWCTEEYAKVNDPEKVLFKLGYQDDPIVGGEYFDQNLNNTDNNNSTNQMDENQNFKENDTEPE